MGQETEMSWGKEVRRYDGGDIPNQIGTDVLLEQGRKRKKVGDIP